MVPLYLKVICHLHSSDVTCLLRILLLNKHELISVHKTCSRMHFYYLRPGIALSLRLSLSVTAVSAAIIYSFRSAHLLLYADVFYIRICKSADFVNYFSTKKLSKSCSFFTPMRSWDIHRTLRIWMYPPSHPRWQLPQGLSEDRSPGKKYPHLPL